MLAVRGRSRRPGTRTLSVALALAALAALAGAGSCRKKGLLPRGEGAAVVVVAADASVSGAPFEVAEIEPNEKLASAQPLALSPIGVTIVGGLSEKDVDVFRIGLADLQPDAGTLPDAASRDAVADAAGSAAAAAIPVERSPDRVLSLSLAASGGALVRVEILDGRGAVRQAVSARDGTAGIPNLALFGSDDNLVLRLVRVRTKDGNKNRIDAGLGDAGYRLSVVPRTFLPGDEIEPNGDAAHATRLAAEAATVEVAGFLGWRRDSDWFELPDGLLPPNGSLVIDVELPPGVAASVAVVDVRGLPWVASGLVRGRATLPPARAPAPPDATAPAPVKLYLVVQAEVGSATERRYVARVRAEVGPEAGP